MPCSSCPALPAPLCLPPAACPAQTACASSSRPWARSRSRPPAAPDPWTLWPQRSRRVACGVVCRAYRTSGATWLAGGRVHALRASWHRRASALACCACHNQQAPQPSTALATPLSNTCTGGPVPLELHMLGVPADGRPAVLRGERKAALLCRQQLHGSGCVVWCSHWGSGAAANELH